MREQTMRISAIVAMGKNRLIGRDNDLPWRLSADLKKFKSLTMGHTLVMGRKTYDSIGKPLPGRKTIVLSRNGDLKIEGVSVVSQIEQAIELAKSWREEELFIAGGAGIYSLAMPRVTRIYLTSVHCELEGDTYFPELSADQWIESERQSFQADKKNEYDFDFIILDKKNRTFP